MTTIEINGESKQVHAATLEDLLNEIGFDNVVVATAVNARFVPKEGRSQFSLTEGDRVEILAPMQGG